MATVKLELVAGPAARRAARAGGHHATAQNETTPVARFADVIRVIGYSAGAAGPAALRSGVCMQTSSDAVLCKERVSIVR